MSGYQNQPVLKPTTRVLSHGWFATPFDALACRSMDSSSANALILKLLPVMRLSDAPAPRLMPEPPKCPLTSEWTPGLQA